MERKFYAGIGSRETPPEIRAIMTGVAVKLYHMGYWLRSGHAPGADIAFELGAADHKEIFLPWAGFNGAPTNDPTMIVPHLTDAHMQTVDYYHPAPNRLKHWARQLMARNACQVLGEHLNDPVHFVMCWTPKGLGGGGTGQAIRIAHDRGIEVVDLGDEAQLHKVKLFLEQH